MQTTYKSTYTNSEISDNKEGNPLSSQQSIITAWEGTSTLSNLPWYKAKLCLYNSAMAEGIAQNQEGWFWSFLFQALFKVALLVIKLIFHLPYITLLHLSINSLWICEGGVLDGSYDYLHTHQSTLLEFLGRPFQQVAGFGHLLGGTLSSAECPSWSHIILLVVTLF
jgi:hypothetical protein